MTLRIIRELAPLRGTAGSSLLQRFLQFAFKLCYTK